MNIESFRSLINEKEEINLHPARLIPFYKPGDEMSLTSIFLYPLIFLLLSCSTEPEEKINYQKN